MDFNHPTRGYGSHYGIVITSIGLSCVLEMDSGINNWNILERSGCIQIWFVLVSTWDNRKC